MKRIALVFLLLITTSVFAATPPIAGTYSNMHLMGEDMDDVGGWDIQVTRDYVRRGCSTGSCKSIRQTHWLIFDSSPYAEFLWGFHPIAICFSWSIRHCRRT